MLGRRTDGRFLSSIRRHKDMLERSRTDEYEKTQNYVGKKHNK